MSARAEQKRETYQAFAKRLNDACDAAGLPGYRNGRQSYFKERLNLSAEGVRRWFAAESIPRPGMIVEIARILKVDPSWLAYGQGQGNEAKAPSAGKAPIDRSAAVGYAASLLQFTGAAVAFNPPSPEVDLIAIQRGMQVSVRVCEGREVEGEVVFDVPLNYENLFLVAVFAGPHGVLSGVIEHEQAAAGAIRNARRRVKATVRDGALEVGGVALRPVGIFVGAH